MIKKFEWPAYTPKQGLDRLLIDATPNNIDLVATELSRLSRLDLVAEPVQLVCDEAAGILKAILRNGYDKGSYHKKGKSNE